MRQIKCDGCDRTEIHEVAEATEGWRMMVFHDMKGDRVRNDGRPYDLCPGCIATVKNVLSTRCAQE